MKKKIILLAGLPGSGKDTVADFFEKDGYFLMSYSHQILKPIIKNPEINLKFFIEKTINKISKQKLKEIINQINIFKITQTGRELYITIAQYLNKICAQLTKNLHSHFTLFATTYYDNKNRIIVAGFRQKSELDILKTLYPNAVIKTIFINCPDEQRFQRLKLRDNIDKKIIQENEKYELETTYNIMMKEVKFNYNITNDSTLKNLENQIKDLIKEIKKL